MNFEYPENTADIIHEIVIKYGFLDSAKKEFEKNINNNENLQEASKKLPNYLILKLIDDYINENIAYEEFQDLLREELKTTDEISKMIFNEIKERILTVDVSQNKPVSQENIADDATEKPNVLPNNKKNQNKYSNIDTYREPIE